MTARTSATKKAKGTRLEKKVAERYRHWDIDKDAKRMPLSGAIPGFKGDIFKRDDPDWVDECKSYETVRLSSFWAQTVVQAPRVYQHPVLHVSANYRPIVTIITESDFDDLSSKSDRGFDRIDITSKKRYNFWEYASRVQDIAGTATVVDIVIGDQACVILDIDTYMKLRVEQIAADELEIFRQKVNNAKKVRKSIAKSA